MDFFKKTKTLRSSKLCTCSPRDKYALFPEGNAPEVIHTPPLRPTHEMRWARKEADSFLEGVGGRQQPSTQIHLQSQGWVR